MLETKPPDFIDMIGDAVGYALGSTPYQPHPIEQDREVYMSPSEEDDEENPLVVRTRSRSRMCVRSKSLRPARSVSRSRVENWDPPRPRSRSRVSDPPRYQREPTMSDARKRSKSEPRRRYDAAVQKAPYDGAAGAAPPSELDLLGMTVETRNGDNSSYSSRLSGTLDHLGLQDPNLARKQYGVMKKLMEEREKVGTKRSVYTRSSTDESRSRHSAENTVTTFTTESRTPVHTIMEERCDEADVREYETPVKFASPRPNGSIIPAIARGVQMALSDDHRNHNASDSEVSGINKNDVRRRVQQIVLKEEQSVVVQRKGPEQLAMDLHASTRVTRQGETPLRQRDLMAGESAKRPTQARPISSAESSSELTPHGKKLQMIKRNFSVGAAARNELRITAPRVMGGTSEPKAPEQDWRSDLFTRPVQERRSPQQQPAAPVESTPRASSPRKNRSDESVLNHQQMVQESWQQQQVARPRKQLRSPDPPQPRYDEYEPSVRAAESPQSLYEDYKQQKYELPPQQQPIRQEPIMRQQPTVQTSIVPREIANRAVSDTVSQLSTIVGGSVISFAQQARKAYDPTKALSPSSPIPELSAAPETLNRTSKALSSEINKVVDSLVGKNQDCCAQPMGMFEEAYEKEASPKANGSIFTNLLGMNNWNAAEPKQDPDVLTKNTNDYQAIESLSNRLQEAEKQTERLQKEVTVLKEALDDTASASQSWWPFSGTDQERTVSTSNYPSNGVPSAISEETGSTNEAGGMKATGRWSSCHVFDPVILMFRHQFQWVSKSSSIFNMNFFESKEDENKVQKLRKLKEENVLLRKEMKRLNKKRHGTGQVESEDNSGSMSSSISSYTESLLTKNTFATRASESRIEASTSFEATEMTYGPRRVETTDTESLFSYSTKLVSVAGSKASRRSEPASRYSSEPASKTSRQSEIASKYSRMSDLVSKTSRKSAQTNRTGRASEIASKSSRRSDETLKANSSVKSTGMRNLTSFPSPAEAELNLTLRSAVSSRSNAAASVASSTRSQPLTLRPKTPRVPAELLDEARRLRGTASPANTTSQDSHKSFRDKINALKYKAISDGVLKEGTN